MRTVCIEPEGRTFRYLLRAGPPEIAVTQKDVRAIQLAKGALYAGVRLLKDRYGAKSVDRITLAGAFGSHIDVTYAMVLGLVPDCDPARVASAGNAAGTGARIAFLNAAARDEIEALVREIEKVETAIEPAFREQFVAAMAMPHGHDPFPRLEANLGRVFARPAGGAGGAGGRKRRRSKAVERD